MEKFKTKVSYLLLNDFDDFIHIIELRESLFDNHLISTKSDYIATVENDLSVAKKYVKDLIDLRSKTEKRLEFIGYKEYKGV